MRSEAAARSLWCLERYLNISEIFSHFSDYSLSDHYFLENMEYYVIDCSRVAEISSYRNHISTVIHIVKLAICRVSAAQDDVRVPLVVLSSCYLWFPFLFWKVIKRLHKLTCFSLLPTKSFVGLTRFSVFDILQIVCGCNRFVVGAMQPLAHAWLGPISNSALVREIDFLGLSTKSCQTRHISSIDTVDRQGKLCFPQCHFSLNWSHNL